MSKKVVRIPNRSYPASACWEGEIEDTGSTAKNLGEAVMGRGVGFQGNSYGIPTKDHQIQTLPLLCIASYVKGFLKYAEMRPDTTFHVTQIGCGLAGLEPKDIAPMFHDAPSNCQFSSAWEPWLPGRVYWTDK